MWVNVCVLSSAFYSITSIPILGLYISWTHRRKVSPHVDQLHRILSIAQFNQCIEYFN